MKLRSILAAIFACVLLCAAVPVAAADCAHDYTAEAVPATCVEKAKTVYTCALCGDTYTVYADEYTLPEEFYVFAESEKKDGQLVVTVSAGNSPGLYTMTLTFVYNAAVLRPVTWVNGDMWKDDEVAFPGQIGNPFRYYAEHTTFDNNEKNGTVCTIWFDILDADAPYGFDITVRKGDIVDRAITPYFPTVVNQVGKSELGSHDYVTETVPATCITPGAVQDVCGICGDTVIREELPTTEHTFVRTVIRQPTYTEEGQARDVCAVCGEESLVALPVLVRWKTGDVNNDGELSVADMVCQRRVVAMGAQGIQEYDAADIDHDGNVTPTDMAYLRRILAGLMPFPDDWD